MDWKAAAYCASRNWNTTIWFNEWDGNTVFTSNRFFRFATRYLRAIQVFTSFHLLAIQHVLNFSPYFKLEAFYWVIAFWVVWLNDDWYLLSLCENIICDMEFGLAICLTDSKVSADFVFSAEGDVFLFNWSLIKNYFNFTCGFLRSRCKFCNQHILYTCMETSDFCWFAVHCLWQFIRQLHCEGVCCLCLRCTLIKPCCDRQLHAKKLVLFCFLLNVSLAWLHMSLPNWDFFKPFKK